MRFMVIVKATPESEAGVMPSQDDLMAMGKYNEELVKAGIMLDGAGLHPSTKGARLRFEGGKTTVIDGPFAETKELIAGYWLWDCKSLDEAVEWARRCPGDSNSSFNLEIRQLFDMSDFEDGPGMDQAHKVAEELSQRDRNKG